MKREDIVSESVAGLAVRGLNNDPLWYVLFFTILSFVGMIALGFVDIALNYSLMASSMANAVTGEIPNSPVIWFGAAVMLVAYWGLARVYAKSFTMRRLAYAGFVGIVIFLTVMTYPAMGPKLDEMLTSASGASPFGGHVNAGGGGLTQALKVVFAALCALLFTGPGLLAVFAEGSFVHWIEKCRHRSQAKKAINASDQMNGALEAAHVKTLVVDHHADPSVQSQTVRAIVHQAIDAYLAAVEIRERRARTVLANIEASKARKQEAERELLAAESCRNALNLLTY